MTRKKQKRGCLYPQHKQHWRKPRLLPHLFNSNRAAMKERVQGHLSNEMSAMQPVDLNGKGKLRCNTLEPSSFFGTEKDWTRVLLFSLVLEIRQLSYSKSAAHFSKNSFDFRSPGSLTLGRDTAENHSRCTWHHELDCETWAMRILRQTHPQKRKALFATLPS